MVAKLTFELEVEAAAVAGFETRDERSVGGESWLVPVLVPCKSPDNGDDDC